MLFSQKLGLGLLHLPRQFRFCDKKASVSDTRCLIVGTQCRVMFAHIEHLVENGGEAECTLDMVHANSKLNHVTVHSIVNFTCILYAYLF